MLFISFWHSASSVTAYVWLEMKLGALWKLWSEAAFQQYGCVGCSALWQRPEGAGIQSSAGHRAYQPEHSRELGAEALPPCDWGSQNSLQAGVQRHGSSSIFFSLQCIISCLLKFTGETCPDCLRSAGSNYGNNQLMHVRQKPFVFIMKGKDRPIKNIFIALWWHENTLCRLLYLEIITHIGGALLKKTEKGIIPSFFWKSGLVNRTSWKACSLFLGDEWTEGCVG